MGDDGTRRTVDVEQDGQGRVAVLAVGWHEDVHVQTCAHARVTRSGASLPPRALLRTAPEACTHSPLTRHIFAGSVTALSSLGEHQTSSWDGTVHACTRVRRRHARAELRNAKLAGPRVNSPAVLRSMQPIHGVHCRLSTVPIVPVLLLASSAASAALSLVIRVEQDLVLNDAYR